jgi:hypothetical protein
MILFNKLLLPEPCDYITGKEVALTKDINVALINQAKLILMALPIPPIHGAQRRPVPLAHLFLDVCFF